MKLAPDTYLIITVSVVRITEMREFWDNNWQQTYWSSSTIHVILNVPSSHECKNANVKWRVNLLPLNSVSEVSHKTRIYETPDNLPASHIHRRTKHLRARHALTDYRSILTVMTALALLSAKSMPSLTLPRHTAKNRAPVIAWFSRPEEKKTITEH